jgi:hypothetical protein
LVDAEFPATMAGDVLAAVGLDPDMATTQAEEIRRANTARSGHRRVLRRCPPSH